MKNSLHNLVAGMSAAEKRAFKQRFGHTRSEKRYLQLFDLISNSSSYSDEKARKKLGVGQIRVLKFRLQEHLLTSLSHQFTLNEAYRKPDLNQVRVLQSKRLFEDALSLLGRQMRAAKEAEDFHTIVQLLDLKENLLRLSPRQAFSTAVLLAIHEEKEKYLGLLQHSRQLEKLRSLLIQVRIEHTPDRSDLIPGLYAKYLGEFREHLDEKKLETVTQQCHYHEIRFLQSDCQKDWDSAIAHSKKRIELHDSGSKAQVLTVGGLAAMLNNHLIVLFKSRRLRDTLPFIEKFRALRSPDLNLQTQMFYSSHVAYTNYLIMLEEIAYTEATLTGIETQLNGIYSRQHEKEMTLRYNIGVLYFRLGRLKKARRIFFRLLSDPAQQKHIGIFAQVLFLICLFELKDAEVFEKEAASFMHQKKKEGPAFLFELTLLRFLQTLLEKNASAKEIKRAFKLFYETKASSMLKGKYRQAMDYFDFERYLLGKFLSP